MSIVDQVVGWATAQIGKPYVFGDEGPDTFDCSGLMQWTYAKIGVQLPRTAREQQAALTPVTDPRPGDLVFFGRPAHHVGMYIGDGQMVNAPGRGKTVRVQAVGNPTSYGRPLAGFSDPIGSVTDWLGVDDKIGQIMAGARGLAITGAFLALGALLVGLGLWRATGPARQALPVPTTPGRPK